MRMRKAYRPLLLDGFGITVSGYVSLAPVRAEVPAGTVDDALVVDRHATALYGQVDDLVGWFCFNDQGVRIIARGAIVVAFGFVLAKFGLVVGAGDDLEAAVFEVRIAEGKGEGRRPGILGFWSVAKVLVHGEFSLLLVRAFGQELFVIECSGSFGVKLVRDGLADAVIGVTGQFRAVGTW
ncbi:MAG: hypothetical protein ACI819_000133 [Neolewinella sp.]|jgi:hypothetical protein